MRAQSDEAKAFSTSPRRCSDPLFQFYSEHYSDMFSDVQVQNLTPQLVNAGTIKMTYPENKVMMIKTVFEDDGWEILCKIYIYLYL